MGCASSQSKVAPWVTVAVASTQDEKAPQFNSINSSSSSQPRSRVSMASIAVERARKSLAWMKKPLSKKSKLSHGLTLVPRSGKILDHYVLDKSDQIGKGAVGTVYKGKNKTSGLECAIKKCFDVRADDRESYKRESAMLGSMDHPNVIKLHEVFEDRRCVYFVMELCYGDELLRHIVQEASLTEASCAYIMKQVFRGASYIHHLEFCHRDLKPENLLLQDTGPIQKNILKIIDFGTATQITPGQYLETVIGTPSYMAPEVLAHRYDSKCDVWSCGVILYFLLSGMLPFSGEDNSEIFAQVKLGKYEFAESYWQHVSEDARDLVGKCFTMGAAERPGAGQCLQQIWIKHEAPHAPTQSLPTHLFENMRNFNNQGDMRKIALHSVAMHLSGSSATEIREQFLAMDTSNDGRLTFEELRVASADIPEEHLRIMFDTLDSDGSGSIDYTEFLAAAMDTRCQVQEATCWAAFRAFDRDGDGTISAAELEKVLNYDGVQDIVESRDVDRLLREADTSGDGVISFDEFMLMVTGALGSHKEEKEEAVSVD